MHYTTNRNRDISGSSAMVNGPRPSTYYLALMLFMQYLSGSLLNIPLRPTQCGHFIPMLPRFPLWVHSDIYTYLPSPVFDMGSSYLSSSHHTCKCHGSDIPRKVCLVGNYQLCDRYVSLHGAHYQYNPLELLIKYPPIWCTTGNYVNCVISCNPALEQTAVNSWQPGTRGYPPASCCLASHTALCAHLCCLPTVIHPEWRTLAAKPADGLFTANLLTPKVIAYAMFGLCASLLVVLSRSSWPRKSRCLKEDRPTSHSTHCHYPVCRGHNAGILLQPYFRICVPHQIRISKSNCELTHLFLIAPYDICYDWFTGGHLSVNLDVTFIDTMYTTLLDVTDEYQVLNFDIHWPRIMWYLISGTLLFYECYVNAINVYNHPDTLATCRFGQLAQSQCSSQCVFFRWDILWVSGPVQDFVKL